MPITRVRVDAAGVRARSRDEAVLDVSFDGRRIWSFWLHRDGQRAGLDHLVPWPETLEDFLDGVVEVTVQEHGAEEELLREEIRLGTSPDRIRVVNGRGRPIVLDKYFRRVESFAGRSDEDVEPLMASIREVAERCSLR